MKKIKNKKTTIQGENGVLNYAELAKLCVNQPKQGGYTVTDMQQRLRILDKLDKKGDVIEIEDADFEVLKPLVKNMKWAIIHKDLVDFVNYLTNL